MKYILFGTGDYYKRFCHWFKNRDVVAVVDNNREKQGTVLDGYPIISPDMVMEYSFDAIVVLSFYIKEMKSQLLCLGVPEEKIYHFYDLHELFRIEETEGKKNLHIPSKSILLLSHDLLAGGPALALFHAALVLKKAGYEVVLGSMMDGSLRTQAEDNLIPVIVDERLQISTMRELPWTHKYDLIICSTINYHTFLSDRDNRLPVIWWLHDSPFFYDGINETKLREVDETNMKMLSVGSVPRNAMMQYKPAAKIEDLIYGVSNGI